MRAGQKLAGRYRLEHQLGSGGMGQVWEALDLRLDRRVAVKTLFNQTDELTDQELALFHREGKAAARLNHPHIATVHDTDVHNGRPFLVLELLAGPNLATLLKDHPHGLPINTVLEYGAQAAEGLTAAHAAGVIHRDIKPANLMLNSDGALKICDFGIARLEDATALLATAGVLGTFAYMPPEQALGESVTNAADIYALGATLSHLLTGRLLFPTVDRRALIGQILHQPPPSPSSLRPAIPQTLDTYLLTLLAKDPAARPPTHTIAAQLRRLAHQLPPESALDNAEHLARTITDPFVQAEALSKVAKLIAERDPARADALIDDAEHLIHTLTGMRGFFTEPHYQAHAQMDGLVQIADVVAEWNPAKAAAILAEAERLAHQVADALSRADPRRAAEILAETDRLAHDILTRNPTRAVPAEADDSAFSARIVALAGFANPADAESLAKIAKILLKQQAPTTTKPI